MHVRAHGRRTKTVVAGSEQVEHGGAFACLGESHHNHRGSLRKLAEEEAKMKRLYALNYYDGVGDARLQVTVLFATHPKHQLHHYF